MGAAGRGHDDLTPHALIVPFYWVLLSVAGYLALIELIVRPYHWQKTEHGSHLKEEAGASSPAAAEATLERSIAGCNEVDPVGLLF